MSQIQKLIMAILSGMQDKNISFAESYIKI